MSNPGPASTTGSASSNIATNQARRLLGYAKGVNLNVTGDTVISILANPGSYTVADCIVTNASTSLTTAHSSLYPQASAGGTAIVADAALSALTAASVVLFMTVAATKVTQAQDLLYFHVGTAQGAAATADVYIYGYDFTTP